MGLPAVVIIGRPNVGKSSLFNALVGSRIAIVDPTAGVTRDRVATLVHIQEREFELVDTGGLGAVDEAGLSREIAYQIDIALTEADLILFVVDAKEGVLAPDRQIAEKLRCLAVPVIAVINKADSFRLEHLSQEHFSLGFGEPAPASALTGRGIDELKQRIAAELPEGRERLSPEGALKVAIVGRMNVGKSTLVNYLVQQPRMIVSEVPGTTRDAVDVPFELEGRKWVAVDTAGMRKARALQGSPDFYAQLRAERAIRRADVVLLLIDAQSEITRVDNRIADEILTAAKPCAIAITKWDLAETVDPARYQEYVESNLPALSFMPITFLSAKTGFNVAATFKLLLDLHGQAGQRAGTGELNKALERALTERAPKPKRGRGARQPKVFYVTQVDVHPPTIVVFVNDPELFSEAYRRYLAARFREMGLFNEVAIKIYFKGRHPSAAEPTTT